MIIALRNLFLIVPFSLIVLCCTSKKGQLEEDSKKTLSKGIWRATLSIQGQSLPFLMEVSDSNQIALINGKEKLSLEASISGDSVLIPMHIFDTEIKAKLNNDRLDGVWEKNYVSDYAVPFQAKLGERYRFEKKGKSPVTDISGKWSVAFLEKDGTVKDAVGLFKQDENHLSGTFLTTTGDYRYLDGVIQGDELLLSTFDGENAYLFKATVSGDSIVQGDFWSGKSSHKTWNAVKNKEASLPNSDSLTFLKEGYNKVDFSFPNLEGDTVSLSDEKYRNKVVILQLFGTWCPNCMDETKFLAKWYKKHSNQDVEIIGLAYERKPDFEYARGRVQKMIDKLGVTYDFLIAGTSDKESAAASLPMLNHIKSFPTTVIIDKTGRVRKIHTGFTGPGTGVYYEQFVSDFNLFLDKLLAEE